jgi:hypothetical protein
MFDPGIGKS